MTTQTAEQINIALCEFRGWMEVRRVNGTWMGVHPDETRMLPQAVMTVIPEPKRMISIAPNHITGPEALGNCHEVEKLLNDKQYNRFCSKLSLLCADDYHEGQKHWCADPISATALQRATALYHTIKKL